MKLARILSMALVSAPLFVGAQGCAANDDAPADSTNQDVTAGAGVQFTTSVGAVVVNGKRVCTAALVDVDAEAHIGSASLSGRQIVIGGACVGRLRNGFDGVAAFVIAQHGVSLATPILSFDFESQVEAGLAVGVLSNRPQDTQPIKLYGASGTVTGGAQVGTVLKADENGVLVGAGVSVNAGVEFNLVTRCSDFHFQADASATVAAGFAADDDGLGAAAIVEVDGHLEFAASIDGGCVVRRVGHLLHHIAEDCLEVATDFANGLASSGNGDPIGVFEQHGGTQTIRVRVNKPSTTIQIGFTGTVSAVAKNIRTFDESGPLADTPCAAVASKCEIRPIIGGSGAPRGFKAGQLVDIEITTHGLGKIFIASTNN